MTVTVAVDGKSLGRRVESAPSLKLSLKALSVGATASERCGTSLV